MNFGDMVQAIIGETGRPDKLVFIRQKINEALNFYVTDINGTRDSQELLLPIDPNEYTQAIDLTVAPFIRFRKFSYLRRSGTTCYLKEIFVNDVANRTTNFRDKYYQMGTSVNISLAALAIHLDVCYYQYPPILTEAPGNNTHWLMESGWPGIYNRALAATWRSIGDDQEARNSKAEADEYWRAKRMDLEAGGTQ